MLNTLHISLCSLETECVIHMCLFSVPCVCVCMWCFNRDVSDCFIVALHWCSSCLFLVVGCVHELFLSWECDLDVFLLSMRLVFDGYDVVCWKWILSMLLFSPIVPFFLLSFNLFRISPLFTLSTVLTLSTLFVSCCAPPLVLPSVPPSHFHSL